MRSMKIKCLGITKSMVEVVRLLNIVFRRGGD